MKTQNAAVLEELQVIGTPAMASQLDATHRDGLEPAFRQVEEQLNRSAYWSTTPASSISAAACWKRILPTGRSMKERNEGKIINLASMYWFFGSGLGETGEMAGTAVFLASRASDFVTGVTIPVDGGYSVR